MDTVTDAIDRLTDAIAGLDPGNEPPAEASRADDSQVSIRSHRTSTPKRPPIKRNLAPALSEVDISLLDAPPHTNAQLLGAPRTRRHVDQVFREANERFPQTDGKAVFDQYLNRPVQYCMPRHFLAPHSQRRIKNLDSHDDLNIAEFIQGYTSMILQNDINNSVVRAMVTQLHKLGEALVDYEWEDMRDWANATLHDIGQKRYKWEDNDIIYDNYNATKMRAARSKGPGSTMPICGLYNQGKCESQASHGSHQHICVACWLNNGACYPHPYTACRRKNNQIGSQGRNNRDKYSQAAPQGGAGNRQHYLYQAHPRPAQTDANRAYVHEAPQPYYQPNHNVHNAKN